MWRTQKIFFVLLGFLFVILLVIGLTQYKDRSNIQTFEKDVGGLLLANQEKSELLSNLPIPQNHQNVGSVLIHYFLTGTIAELKQVPEGTQIIFAGDDQKILPRIIATQESRISRISQPYSDATTKRVKVSGLHVGMQIDISIEYDLQNHTWIVHDVFVPTDRNP